MVSNKCDIVKKWVDDRLNVTVPVQTVPYSVYERAGITWDILRTDLIHPVCSGNKLFKLKYYLLDATQKNYTKIQTEGGPWSNHIVATAFAAKEIGLTAMGIIHGDEPTEKSRALQDAENYGMELHYKGWGLSTTNSDHFADTFQIPQGGFGHLGVKGAKEIIPQKLSKEYSHIICAVGTGTMLAGISMAAPNTNVIGIPVLKNTNITLPIQQLIGTLPLRLIHDYHFGGYAKKTNELLNFMNQFYSISKIPLDFVYTGKLMFAIHDLIQNKYFPEGSKILAIHSGGLQGNRSLTKGELIF